MTTMKAVKGHTTITLTWKECEAIAHYYAFPAVVFLLERGQLLKKLRGTRSEALKKKFEELREESEKFAERAKEIL